MMMMINSENVRWVSSGGGGIWIEVYARGHGHESLSILNVQCRHAPLPWEL